jgi:hypothetical protein
MTHPRGLISALVVLLLLAASAALSAEPETAAASGQAPWELVGLMSVGGQFRFRLHNRVDDERIWLPLQKSTAGLTIESYNGVTDTIQLRDGNATYTLSLRKAATVAGAMAALSGPTPAEQAELAAANARYVEARRAYHAEMQSKSRAWTGTSGGP